MTAAFESLAVELLWVPLDDPVVLVVELLPVVLVEVLVPVHSLITIGTWAASDWAVLSKNDFTAS